MGLRKWGRKEIGIYLNLGWYFGLNIIYYGIYFFLFILIIFLFYILYKVIFVFIFMIEISLEFFFWWCFWNILLIRLWLIYKIGIYYIKISEF